MIRGRFEERKHIPVGEMALADTVFAGGVMKEEKNDKQ